MPGFSGACSYDEGAVLVLQSPFFVDEFNLNWNDLVDPYTGMMDFRSATAYCKALYDCAYVVEDTPAGTDGDECTLLRIDTVYSAKELDDEGEETGKFVKKTGPWNQVNVVKYTTD
ncbi:unnamed protein product, partial [Amoebophrya sp. A120]|eukprot:GSA120T00015481001.1